MRRIELCTLTPSKRFSGFGFRSCQAPTTHGWSANSNGGFAAAPMLPYRAGLPPAGARCARGTGPWAHGPWSRLALIIVLDQFSRSLLSRHARQHLRRTRGLSRSWSKGLRSVDYAALSHSMGEDLFLLTVWPFGAVPDLERGRRQARRRTRQTGAPESFVRYWSTRRRRPVAIETLLPASGVIRIATRCLVGDRLRRNWTTLRADNSCIRGGRRDDRAIPCRSTNSWSGRAANCPIITGFASCPPLNCEVLDGEEPVVPNVPESDWRTFRELREVALQRFCERILGEVVPITNDRSRTHHERYLALFRVMQDRDEQLAHVFNDPARSRMIVQLAALHVLGLLRPHELERFTLETRSMVESLTEEPCK